MEKSIRLGLSSNQLKGIALATMTIDHAVKLFYNEWFALLAGGLGLGESIASVLLVVILALGRLTIYLFLWLVAEGCRHTRDVGAYLRRIVLFGLLAEVPFQAMLCFIKEEPLTLALGCTNVMFTLALGVLACRGYRTLIEEKGAAEVAALWLPLVCAFCAELLHTDYGSYGVVCLFLIYRLQEKKTRLGVLALMILLMVVGFDMLPQIAVDGLFPALLLFYGINLAGALLAVPLLYAYDGARGRGGTKMRYLFYAYYPLHIAVLVLIRMRLA